MTKRIPENKKPTALGKKRLLVLADILENDITNKQFDLNDFGTVEPKCGTVACALGWAAINPRIRGLKVVYFGDNNEYIDVVLKSDPKIKDFIAGKKYFQITYEQIVYLFSNSIAYTAINPRPATVAKVIRKFVNDNGITNKKWIEDYVT